MRPRKKNRHLPACVYHQHGAYWLVKRGQWTRLGTDLKAALAEYARLMQAPTGGMARLIRDALPVITRKVATATKAQYQVAARKLEDILVEFSPEDVRPKHIAQMRRALAETPNMANRMLSVLRQVFAYAVEEQLVDSNPCVGIERLPERKRDRLITQAEFDAIYAQAPLRLQCMMQIWYLTGQRVMDVVAIRRSDIREDGLYFRQAKTDAKLLVRWSTELRAAVDRAKELNGLISSLSLFSTQRGSTRGAAPSYGTIRDQWRRACAAAGVQDADMRDLRAMSGTAARAQGKDPTALLGHASPAMTQRYLRDREIPEVDGPSFRHVKKERR